MKPIARIVSRGQTPGDTLDSTAVADRQFGVSLGMRRESPFPKNFKKYSPCGSLQMTWFPPSTSLWLSLRFFRQIDRWNSSSNRSEPHLYGGSGGSLHYRVF